MAQRQDDAYVLGTNELGEADLIVTLLAESAGRLRGVASFARKSRRRFGGALEPLTRVRASWSEREGRDLHRLESLETARSYATMQSDPLVQATCAVLCEIASAMGREGEAEPKVFRLIGAVLDALEAGLTPTVAVRYFEFWTLRLHGLLIDTAACGACGAALGADDAVIAIAGQGVLCSACARACGHSGRALTRADRAFLAAAALLPPARMGEHAAAASSGGALEALLRGSLETFVERRFKTYRHLDGASAPHKGVTP